MFWTKAAFLKESYDKSYSYLISVNIGLRLRFVVRLFFERYISSFYIIIKIRMQKYSKASISNYAIFAGYLVGCHLMIL